MKHPELSEGLHTALLKNVPLTVGWFPVDVELHVDKAHSQHRRRTLPGPYAC